MLIEDFRERSRANKVRSILKIPNHDWRFEILVYHLMLRLIRTSKNDGRQIACYSASSNHQGRILSYEIICPFNDTHREVLP
jgi:hypothetical protein